MQLFFVMPFRQTASTSIGLNNLGPAATEGIYVHFFKIIFIGIELRLRPWL